MESMVAKEPETMIVMESLVEITFRFFLLFLITYGNEGIYK